ncbi:MAG: hypothetical protein LBE92_20695 [Chryseobacterium sp.]|jgi:hypothetical protein|uniref:hypothetical protein n=1 Tax=Chryseobacterium sp. TaxID=1871047 RepID=UPI0028391A09|nr:hypothetical protein [Chryseobacterium sp.]MDR2238555.1 hypothetical protein [Chryseobacterium sp.]
MRKNLYLIIILFSLVSCYTYQVKKPGTPPADNKQDLKKSLGLANTASPAMKSTITETKNSNLPPAPVPINVQEALVPNKKFKIDVEGRSYKIIVDRWESDSLVAHPVSNPKKTLKFHKNQINSEKIAEKRFSQPIADIITVTAYAGIAALIWVLIR